MSTGLRYPLGLVILEIRQVDVLNKTRASRKPALERPMSLLHFSVLRMRKLSYAVCNRRKHAWIN